jgi:hypothetical protein
MFLQDACYDCHRKYGNNKISEILTDTNYTLEHPFELGQFMQYLSSAYPTEAQRIQC